MKMDITDINMIIVVSGLVISVLGLLIVLAGGDSGARMKAFFIAFFSILTTYILFVLLSQIVEFYAGPFWATCSRILLFFESFLSAVLTVFITGLLLHLSGEKDFGKHPLFRISLGLWILYMLLLIYTQFSETIYFFDQDNVYHRGPYYPILLIPPVLVMINNLVALWYKRKKLSHKEKLAFLLYAIIPLVSMLVQMCFYGILSVVLGTAIASLCMLLFIILDKSERFYRQEAENADLRIKLLIGQIQPHFLYNSLATIMQLCKDSPEAQGAVSSFTSFLRYNIDSLTQVRPIRFSTELKHLQAYLDLEKLRFGDELQVEYDLKAMDFTLPTLTVEPLVENAVRYGVRGREDGSGTIRISTAEFPDHYEVKVTDDGPGFDPDKTHADGRIHIGIDNARERLARVCGGSLTIASVIGQGTTVTISLPKGEK